MGDESDKASDLEEWDREISKKQRRDEGPTATGYCLNCGPAVPLEDGRRWCDIECRDDWSKHNER